MFVIHCCLVTKSSDSFRTPWTVASQTPLSITFPRQEFWSELPFPSPGDLPDPGIKPVSPTVAGRFFITEPSEKTILNTYFSLNSFSCLGLAFSCFLVHKVGRWKLKVKKNRTLIFTLYSHVTVSL